MRGVQHDARIHDQPHRAWWSAPTANRKNNISTDKRFVAIQNSTIKPRQHHCFTNGLWCASNRTRITPHHLWKATTRGRGEGGGREKGGADNISVTFGKCTRQGFAGTQSGSTGNPLYILRNLRFLSYSVEPHFREHHLRGRHFSPRRIMGTKFYGRHLAILDAWRAARRSNPRPATPCLVGCANRKLQK